MPTYVCKCDTCGIEQDFIRRVADRDDTPTHCGNPTTRLGAYAVAPMVSAMIWTGHAGFVAHNNGGRPEFIESGSQYKSFMKRNDLMPASEGYKHADERKGTLKKERKQRLRKYAEERVRALPT